MSSCLERSKTTAAFISSAVIIFFSILRNKCSELSVGHLPIKDANSLRSYLQIKSTLYSDNYTLYSDY